MADDKQNLPAAPGKAVADPGTSQALDRVGRSVQNGGLELTDDERSALQGMTGLDKAVLLMLSLSEDDAAEVFRNLQPKQ